MIDNRSNEILGQWIRFEHSRLHAVEQWPSSPHKDATLAAIGSTLRRFEAESQAPEMLRCMICASRRRAAVVLEFPSRSRESNTNTRLAA